MNIGTFIAQAEELNRSAVSGQDLNLNKIDLTVKSITAEVSTDVGGDLVIAVNLDPLLVSKFVAVLPYACTLQSIKHVNSVLSTGTAVRAMVRRITADAVAPGAVAGATCIEVVTAGLQLAAAANILGNASLAVTAFSANDRIAIHPTDAGLGAGTFAATSLVGVVTLYFKRSA